MTVPNAPSRLEIIRGITGELTSTLDVDEVLRLIIRLVAEAMAVKGGAVRLLKEGTSEYRLSASWGLSHAYLSKGPIVAESSIAASMQGEVVYIPDVKNDPRLQYPLHAEDEGIVSILSVPMMMMNKTVGVLRLYLAAPRDFTDEDIEFVRTLADLGSLALEHARLYSSLKEQHHSLIEDYQTAFEDTVYRPQP